MLELRGVRKTYSGRVALDGVDLHVDQGSITGLLGPNGAGKTTLVSIVAGLRRPDHGEVLVGGVDVVRSPERAQGLLGLAPQETGVYPTLTVHENLWFFAGLVGQRRRDRREQLESLGAALGLDELMDRRVGQLSGGERRRLHTAIALVGRPPLVLLDEPTTGADVRTRAELLSFVRRLAEDGSTVVYSTHYLHEIEDLDADIAIIDRGRIVARGSLAELVRTHGSSAVELSFGGGIPEPVRQLGVPIGPATIRIPSDDPASTAAHLLTQLGPSVAALQSLEIVRPTLDSVFLTVTGRKISEAESDGS